MMHEGDLLDGKYRILHEIGHGGMSVVYLAINERANKTWAVKEVRKDGGNDKSVVSQGLVAETEMLKKLHHEHLPSIVDVIDTKDSFIIVMDYIEGGSLQKKMEKDAVTKPGTRGAQDPEDVIRWSMQLCDVLGYLHSRKPPIIYRDMKPSNVMLQPDGNVSLIDFGTAREYKKTSTSDTTWLGTRGYAAPEQFGGHGQTDARTDIYCLGATMYHLLTGYSPAETQFIIYPVGQLRPELKGSGIEKIVAKCCQPDPANRYQNCAELMYALEHVHDEDDEVRRQRDKKWHRFVGSLSLTVICFALAIAFNFLTGYQKKSTYQGYLDKGDNEGSAVDAVSDYKEAMDIDPERPEAYTKLLNAVYNDGVISDDDRTMILTCLNSQGSNRRSGRTNIESLKDSDASAYASFEYELGTAYYVGSDALVNEANTCFTNALNTGTLSDKEKKLATTYQTLTQYYAQIAGKGSNEENSSDRSLSDDQPYADLWNALYALVSDKDTVNELSGGQKASLALYREACRQIGSHIVDLKKEGVSMEQMEAVTSEAMEYVNTVGSDTDNNLVNQLQTAIQQAQNAMASSNAVSGSVPSSSRAEGE